MDRQKIEKKNIFQFEKSIVHSWAVYSASNQELQGTPDWHLAKASSWTTPGAFKLSVPHVYLFGIVTSISSDNPTTSSVGNYCLLTKL